MAGICEGRVVIVTGAGRGVGRGHALEFARQGAKVVVNDLGAKSDGSGASIGPAQEVVNEILAMGGQAVANTDDISDWEGAQRLINTAIDTFGGLDVLVNNAGNLRDRMLVNMTLDDWDSVIRVHLRGTFCTTRHAVTYWREQSKNGTPRQARVINTASSSGLYCNPGQANYGAAKAGIASFSIIAAMELGRYGVTVNCIYPTAMSRLTEEIFKQKMPASMAAQADNASADFDPLAPENCAPLVVWLGSEQSSGITGRVFGVAGGRITVAEGWHAGPIAEKAGRWDPAELGAIVPGLVAQAAPNALTSGEIPAKS
ncbi:SDR family oxidoreductase [Pseudomonas cavernae]|uniref:SDR family oxidoreductase n=1 Tax=Pseudomonas cavernae TaxID=2320867 RepID=A0A385Z7Z1_9PSED|nr:SDR family oxidoreductase [Pseudomonas cavernae]AYC34093.1 SDR family oxidoreductase [Pseudomonas cavernae]